MSPWRGLRARARALVRPHRADDELREEIAYHLERETEKNLALGMSDEDARRAALVSFGGAEQTIGTLAPPGFSVGKNESHFDRGVTPA